MSHPSALAVALVFAAAAPLGAQQPERSVVAVVRFDNDTGDARYDNLGRAMSSMMISDLLAIDRIQLVERERMEEVMAEQDLQYSGRVDEETAVTVFATHDSTAMRSFSLPPSTTFVADSSGRSA